MAPIPYLKFRDGEAREALERYQSIFGGELELHAGDTMRPDGSAALVQHGILVGPVRLYGADAEPGDSALPMQGLHLALLGAAEPATLHEWFDALADGGEVIAPLEARPWGASDGQLVDRYGVRWLIGYEHEAQ